MAMEAKVRKAQLTMLLPWLGLTVQFLSAVQKPVCLCWNRWIAKIPSCKKFVRAAEYRALPPRSNCLDCCLDSKTKFVTILSRATVEYVPSLVLSTVVLLAGKLRWKLLYDLSLR